MIIRNHKMGACIWHPLLSTSTAFSRNRSSSSVICHLRPIEETQTLQVRSDQAEKETVLSMLRPRELLTRKVLLTN